MAHKGLESDVGAIRSYPGSVGGRSGLAGRVRGPDPVDRWPADWPVAVVVNCSGSVILAALVTLQDVKGPGKGAGKVCQGMIKIRARGNESVEQMLRRFKKMCEKEGLNKQIKKNSYYEKPSERRRRRIRKAVARRERTART